VIFSAIIPKVVVCEKTRPISKLNSNPFQSYCHFIVKKQCFWILDFYP
jgi:hypothetical protein